MCASVLPIPLFVCIPYYSMNFNIDDDDNYFHNVTILRVRGTHAWFWNELYSYTAELY